MSAVSMSQIAYARRSDTPEERPTDFREANRSAHGSAAPNDRLTSALGAIAAYIPSELVILYTGIIAALSVPESTSFTGQWVAFWLVLGLTPTTVWLLYAARAKSDGKPLPRHPRSWPWLEMTFSLVAFAAWAGALPESPLRDVGAYNGAVATVVVLVVTFLLGLIAPIFGRTIPVGSPPNPDASATAQSPSPTPTT